jgi:hypothetical protein
MNAAPLIFGSVGVEMQPLKHAPRTSEPVAMRMFLVCSVDSPPSFSLTLTALGPATFPKPFT